MKLFQIVTATSDRPGTVQYSTLRSPEPTSVARDEGCRAVGPELRAAGARDDDETCDLHGGRFRTRMRNAGHGAGTAAGRRWRGGSGAGSGQSHHPRVGGQTAAPPRLWA